MKELSKKGFTLAEVLVTLVVIGVVAALSIPALLQNTNQAEMKTGLKKAVSVMNNALLMSVAQDSVDANTYQNATETSPDWLTNMFANKLNTISKTATSFTTADGMIYTFYKPAATLCGTGTATIAGGAGTAPCYVKVDVNGGKTPNADSTQGVYRDIYYLIIKNNSVVPATGFANTTDDVAVDAISGS